MPILLKNVSTNINGPEVDWPGNRGGEFQLDGVFDGATVTVKLSLDKGVTYTEPPEGIGQFTSATAESLNVWAVCKIRATISGAGVSTDLTARID